MKKRICALLMAGLLAVVSACAGTETPRKAEEKLPGEENAGRYAPYVTVCAEEGILDDAEEKNFSPDDPLKMDKLQVMLIRLYNRLHGGDGTIPPLPDDPLDYLRFLDADGNCVAGITEIAESYDRDRELWVEFKTKPAQDELTLQMAFPGDKMYLCAQGSFAPGGVVTEADPHSAAGLLQMVSPDTEYGVVVPDHYTFPVETEQPADAYAYILSSYQFMVENGWFDDSWDEWHYPYIYYWNYREGNVLTESTPRERENPDLSPSDDAWWEDMAIDLGTYCPEVVPWVDVTEEMANERYTYRQNEIIWGLFQEGILVQNDENGEFPGQQPITQGEAAAVIARVLRPELRQGSSTQ